MSAPAIEYLFITPGPLVSIDGHVTSYSAATRLGSIAPARSLMRLGYDARTFSLAGGIEPAEAAVAAAKHVVFGAIDPARAGGWAPSIAAYRRLLARLPDPRQRAVFSIAEDHFDEADFSGFYREVLPECRAVTTGSARLAERVAAFTARPVLVAPEPCEGERGEPHAFTARRPPRALGWLARRIGVPEDLWRLRLLWFGHAAELPPLLELVPALEALARRQPLLLTCVTAPAPEIPLLVSPERTAENARLRARFVPWAPHTVAPEIAACDLVLIPSDYRNAVAGRESPGRLVSGLHGGRFVVAHPLPAYEPYREFAWIGEDLRAGIEWALAHGRELLDRVARGQAFIDEHHSPQVVAQFWLDVFQPATNEARK